MSKLYVQWIFLHIWSINFFRIRNTLQNEKNCFSFQSITFVQMILFRETEILSELIRSSVLLSRFSPKTEVLMEYKLWNFLTTFTVEGVHSCHNCWIMKIFRCKRHYNMSIKRKSRHFWIGCDCIMVTFSRSEKFLRLLSKLFEKNTV